MESKPKVSIPTSEIMHRLQVSRNFVTRNIAPFVTSDKIITSAGSIVCYEEAGLRRWLEKNATISQLTKRITTAEYKKLNDSARAECRLLNPLHRTLCKPVPVKSMDIWDLPLIFPKEYHGSRRDISRITPPELCYRDMFKAGAIKIQLGRQKTMFYIPRLDSRDASVVQEYADKPFDEPDHILVPAMVFPSAKGLLSEVQPLSDKDACTITVTFPEEDYDFKVIIKALQHGITIPLKCNLHSRSIKTGKKHITRISFPLNLPRKKEQPMENEYSWEDIDDFQNEDNHCPPDDKKH